MIQPSWAPDVRFEDDEGNDIHANSVMAWTQLPTGDWLRILLTHEGIITDVFDKEMEEVLATGSVLYLDHAYDIGEPSAHCQDCDVPVWDHGGHWLDNTDNHHDRHQIGPRGGDDDAEVPTPDHTQNADAR